MKKIGPKYNGSVNVRTLREKLRKKNEDRKGFMSFGINHFISFFASSHERN